jgi:MFS family permease
MQNVQPTQMVRQNFIYNLLDGSFYGFALGIASYVTVIPLFMASLTDSTVLIGLIATIHSLGWQLPQLFTAERVSRLTKYRPMVMFLVIHERLPFLALTLLALLTPFLHSSLVIALAFVCVCWQSFGSGLVATPWQSMVAKLFPEQVRGTFYGMQSGGANFLSSVGAFSAGVLLVTLPYPYNFGACFALAGIATSVTIVFLGKTHEDPHEATPTPKRNWREVLVLLRHLLRQDRNFGVFMITRNLAQLSQTALAFFTVFALRNHGADAQIVGIFTGVMLLTQMIASPIMGYLGDKWGHRWALAFGDVAMAASACIAVFAPSVEWLYVVFVLAGIVNSTHWTSILAISSEFGNEQTRPYYVGLSNTLTAPMTLISPIIGGLLADSVGFHSTFIICALMGLVAAFMLAAYVVNPRTWQQQDLPVITRSVAPAGD